MDNINDLDRSILRLRDAFARAKRQVAAQMAEERSARAELIEIRQRLDRSLDPEGRGELLEESARLESVVQNQAANLVEARRLLYRLGDELESARRRRNLYIASKKKRP